MASSTALGGCTPGVLMHHLKALGVFRLVARQKDASVRASWENDTLVLDTMMTGEEIVRFFCDGYMPSPVMSPWNKDRAFYDPDLLAGLINSMDARLRAYRDAVGEATRIVSDIIPGYGALVEKATSRDGTEPAKILAKKAKADLSDERKAAIKRRLHNELGDDGAVEWLDATYALTYDNKAPNGPLLMAGGTDGRTEFSRNFLGVRRVEPFDGAVVA